MQWLITIRKGTSPDTVFKQCKQILPQAIIKQISNRVLIIQGASKRYFATIKAVQGVENIEHDTMGSVITMPPHVAIRWPLRNIYAKAAWLYATGKGQTIAFIDSGIDGTHPEFGGDGDHGINAALGRHVILSRYNRVMQEVRTGKHPKIVQGYNFVDDDDVTFDFYRHGTATASVALGNGVKVAGVAYNAKVHPLKVVNSKGACRQSDLVEAIAWAIHTSTRVINISLAFGYKSKALESIVEEAADAGILIVAGAGNTGREETFYPASFPTVISVGGSDIQHELWRQGRQGSTYPCDIVAPAAPQLVARAWRGRYVSNMGTSLASAIVAGVAALCLEVYPTMSRDTLADVILTTGNKQFCAEYAQWGEVCAHTAVKEALCRKRATAPSAKQQYPLNVVHDNIVKAIQTLQQSVNDLDIVIKAQGH